MPEHSAHDSSPDASAVDAALLTARQAARAAALAVDHLEQAERSTKPQHARRWRIAGFSALQDARILTKRAMEQMAAAVGEPSTGVLLSDVLDELGKMVETEGSMTGADALMRAERRLQARFAPTGGGR